MSSKASAWAQAITGFIIAGLVAACVYNDIMNNVEYGQKISTEMALALGVFGAAIGIIPFASGFVGWNRVFTAAFAVCVTITVYASATAYLNKQGENIVHAADKANAHKAAMTDATAARAELASISETGDVAALTAALNLAQSRASVEASNGGCGARCRAANTTAAQLLERIAQAKARDAAQKRLIVAKADVAKGGAMIDAGAELIARQIGGDAANVAQTLSAIMAGLVIIATQLVAACGHQAARLMASGIAIIFTAGKKPKGKTQAAPSERKGKGGRKANISREQALEILRRQAAATNGRIISSGAALAASLGVGRSTVCDPKNGWLSHWEKTGAITIESKGRKTALKIEKRKAA